MVLATPGYEIATGGGHRRLHDKLACLFVFGHDHYTRTKPAAQDSDRTVLPALGRLYASARWFFCWMSVARIVPPRGWSVISFDNYHTLQALPISTLDFGFGGLGYQAFHAILGDIPVRRTSRGAIGARPTIVHKGSVARVNQSPL